MPRPTTQAELLQQATSEFDRLFVAVDAVADSRREVPGACEQWSVKDLLAHLDAWHSLFLGWEADGVSGEQPDMPAPGFTWAETPALNEELRRRTADDDWDDVVSRLRASHQAVLDVLTRYDDDLFVKRRYRWTGTTSVGSYAVSATSSHYAWASKLIRAWAKSTSA